MWVYPRTEVSISADHPQETLLLSLHFWLFDGGLEQAVKVSLQGGGLGI